MAALLSSIISYRCPKCRHSKIFAEPFVFNKPLEMKDHCPHCQQKFEPEPGFYFGAMFVSYGFSCLTFLPLALLLVFYFGWSVNGMMLFLMTLYGVLFFKILRLSRSIWIHFIVKFDKELNTRISAEL